MFNDKFKVGQLWKEDFSFYNLRYFLIISFDKNHVYYLYNNSTKTKLSFCDYAFAVDVLIKKGHWKLMV